MRVMVIVKASEASEVGVLPSEELLAEMGKFNEELVEAGVMLAGEGLQESAKGARVRFGKGGERTVIDGPFAETKEQLLGFYVIDCATLEEAIEAAHLLMAPRMAAGLMSALEIRPISVFHPGSGAK